MRMKVKVTWSVAALLAVAAYAPTADAQSGASRSTAKAAPTAQRDGVESNVLRIPANAAFPMTRQVTIGVGKSLFVEFPMELRDVMISDPERVDAVVQTSGRVFLLAKKPGSANVVFFDAQGQQILNLEVSTGSDLTGLETLLKRLIPGSNIKPELIGTTVALTGSVRSPADSQRAADITKQFVIASNRSITNNSTYSWTSTAGGGGGASSGTWSFPQSNTQKEGKEVINLLTVEGEEQVMLKVNVVEVNRAVFKQLGINWAGSVASGNFFNSVGTMNSLPITAATLGALPNSGVATAGAPAGAAGCASFLPQIGPNYVGQQGFTGGFSAGGNCLSYTLRAMERQGLVKTLAEPTLTAVSGETARFLAGGEYPVPVSADNGAIGITFKEFGVGVAFTPIVLSEGRISLKVDTSVSELSTEGALVLSGTQIPSLRKRQALSTVELPSGGSLALAGLISETTRQNIEGTPALKDLPVLGALFRSRDFQQSETELVVIITPYMVRPTSRQNLGTPGDGLAAASDLKANLLGHLNRIYGKGRPLPDGGLKGDHGFIVD